MLKSGDKIIIKQHESLVGNLYLDDTCCIIIAKTGEKEYTIKTHLGVCLRGIRIYKYQYVKPISLPLTILDFKFISEDDFSFGTVIDKNGNPIFKFEPTFKVRLASNQYGGMLLIKPCYGRKDIDDISHYFQTNNESKDENILKIKGIALYRDKLIIQFLEELGVESTLRQVTYDAPHHLLEYYDKNKEISN